MMQYTERFFLVAGTKYCHTLTVNVINYSHQKKYSHGLSGIVLHINLPPKKGPLIEEQNIGELNPLYSIARDIPPQCAREENKH
jgi:hypothetical protein